MGLPDKLKRAVDRRKFPELNGGGIFMGIYLRSIVG